MTIKTTVANVFKGEILCLFKIHTFILHFYYNMFTFSCFLITHRFSETVTLNRPVIILCLKHSFLAPVSLSPSPEKKLSLIGCEQGFNCSSQGGGSHEPSRYLKGETNLFCWLTPYFLLTHILNRCFYLG